MRIPALTWPSGFCSTILSGTVPPKFFEGQEEGSESRGNEHSLLWPTLSYAWQRLKGGLESALQDWTSSPANTSSQCGNMGLLYSKRQHRQFILRQGASLSTAPDPAAFLFAILGAQTWPYGSQLRARQRWRQPCGGSPDVHHCHISDHQDNCPESF